jgi:nucleoside transporter
MKINLRLIQIALLFFLKFYILGAIIMTLGLVLGTHGMGAYIGAAYSVGGFTALLAGMLMGEAADRFILPNHLLFLCHLVSGLALWLMPGQVVAGNVLLFLMLLAGYTIFGDATVSVCTRVAFHALSDNIPHYSIARAFGTAGFLAAGLVTGFSGLSASLTTFRIGGAVSILFAFYALTLPQTPSAGRGGRFSFRDLIGWDAFALLRDRNVLVFIILAVAIFFPMSAYNAYLPVYLKDNGIANVGGLMTLAQATEILLMFSLAYFIRRLGIRNILAVACVAWFLILISFAVADRVSFPLIVFGILMHGAGWDFFYAASVVYINDKASEAMKARAQSLLWTSTYGLGTILGSLGSGLLYNALHGPDPAAACAHWPMFWGLIGVIPVLLLFMVLVFFHDGVRDAPQDALSLPVQLETEPIP